jgi:hypothetical protein
MYPGDHFDADRFRIPHSARAMPGGVIPLTPPPPRRPRIPRHKAGELFLRGPIPWRWVQAAARLPGRALAVGCVLWHLIGLRKCHMVRLSPSKTRSLGLSPRVARRGLKALEEAGLVAVDRHRGRSPDVTVLDVAEQEALDMAG